MKVFIVGTVARMVEGEYVFVKLEKGFTEAAKAQEMVNSLAKSFNETIQIPTAGPVPCLCERGVWEVEVEESI